MHIVLVTVIAPLTLEVLLRKHKLPHVKFHRSVLDTVTVIISFPFLCCEIKFQTMPSEPQGAARCCVESEKFTQLFCYSLNPH